MEQEALISIIVPVYNMEKYLDRCMNSIWQQTYKNLEIILVDDGSTDNSPKMCDNYAKKDSRIKVVHKENGGLSDARNAGLAVATGNYIGYVDSDDWIEPGLFELLNIQILEHPADLYGYNAQKVSQTDSGQLITERLLYVVEHETITFHSEKERFSFFFHRFMQYRTGWEVWSRIYRKSVIEAQKLRFFPTQEVFAEDYLFTFEYLLHADTIRLLCNIGYNYFQRESSLLGKLDLKTVLPRLENLGMCAYESVCCAGLDQFKKNYDRLYFMLFNYHLQHLLSSLDEEEVRCFLWDRKRGKRHRRLLKDMRKHLYDFEKYMIKVRWL